MSTARRDVELDLRSCDSNVIRRTLKRRLAAIEETVEAEGLAHENPLTGPEPGSVVRERYYTERLLALDAWDRDKLTAPLHHLDLGPIEVLSLPFEAFVQHGLDLKGAMTAETPLIAGYTNGYLGYLPTSEEFDYGGYAVETSPFTRASVEKLRRAAFDLVS